MELTTEEALAKGVAAHKEGNLQEAERLYRAILQSQPAHPDANHNLGLIAVSCNQPAAAPPLFSNRSRSQLRDRAGLVQLYWRATERSAN